jgi:hypothetical protein
MLCPDPIEAMRWVEDLRNHIEVARANEATELMRTTSAASQATTLQKPFTIPSNASTNSTGPKSTSLQRQMTSMSLGTPSIFEETGDSGSLAADDETINLESDAPPHEESFQLLANSVRAQMEATEQLLDSLVIPSNPPNTSTLNMPARPATTSRQLEVKNALRHSLRRLSSMMDEYTSQIADREKWHQCRYESEIQAKKLWEENMREVATQQVAMEEEFRKVASESARRKKALRSVRASIGAYSPTRASQFGSSQVLGASTSDIGDTEDMNASVISGTKSTSSASRLRSVSITSPPPPEIEDAIEKVVDEESTDSEDDFYDAIESGSVVLKVDNPIADPFNQPWAPSETVIDTEPYQGYAELRRQLPITSDDRPPVSLWAILKGSIGKDLTRISFPVRGPSFFCHVLN